MVLITYSSTSKITHLYFQYTTLSTRVLMVVCGQLKERVITYCSRGTLRLVVCAVVLVIGARSYWVSAEEGGSPERPDSGVTEEERTAPEAHGDAKTTDEEQPGTKLVPPALEVYAR
jgi:hypothetical protein